MKYLVIILFMASIGFFNNSYSATHKNVSKTEMAGSTSNSDAKKSKIVKAVIFDIGNVFVKVELNIWKKAFEKIGFFYSGDLLENKNIRDLIYKYNEGKISTPRFIKFLCREMKIPEVSVNKFEGVWNSVILSVFEEQINIINYLHSKGYRVFALSDTNIMHAEYIEKLYQRLHSNQSFYSLFDKSYLSHLMGYRKSDKRAWIQILKEQNLKPSECLFVDDMIENIKQAQKIGMHVFLYTSESNMKAVHQKLKEINANNLESLNCKH